MLIAELDGKPAGCAYLVTLSITSTSVRTRISRCWPSPRTRKARASVRRCSIAREHWAQERGSDRLTLSALVTNSRARSLYERKGFAGEYIRYVLPL